MSELWLVPLVIWLLIGIVAFIVIDIMDVKLCKHLIRMNRNAKKKIELIEKRTAEKYNKLAAMSQPELDSYLTKTYSVVLEITCATLISGNDPDAMDKLYGNSLIRMLEYIGQESIDALDYYYGKGYVDKWCELRYAFLENSGVIHTLIDRVATSTTVAHALEDTTNKASK